MVGALWATLLMGLKQMSLNTGFKIEVKGSVFFQKGLNEEQPERKMDMKTTIYGHILSTF